jgi:hypothetical protein
MCGGGGAAFSHRDGSAHERDVGIPHPTADGVCLLPDCLHLPAYCIYYMIPCSQTLCLSFLETKALGLSFGGRCGLGLVKSGPRKLGPFYIPA